MIIESHISGIPCKLDCEVHGRYQPAKIDAEPEYCYEAQWPEVEFEVLDRRGRPAPWLAKKLTDADIHRIENEILEYQND